MPSRASDKDVYLTYVTTARRLELVMGYYGILDRVSRGRDESPREYQPWNEYAAARRSRGRSERTSNSLQVMGHTPPR